ncbi:glyoxylate reductase/hydroxypyruvate reductase-like protein, partial [Aphelenchoides avenae]
GIKVGFAGNVLTEATAELAVALLLATSRRIPEAVNSAKNGGWTTWTPFYMCGKALAGSTVGIFGMGRIGESVAEKLAAFKPQRIIYHNRKPKDGKPQYQYVSFVDLVRESDFLVITVCASEDLTGKFNRDIFAQMKKDAVLVNISRGKLVKTMDLYEALHAGTIGAAGLDVVDPEPLPPDHPLYMLNNCVVTPHIGSANTPTRQAMLDLGEANVVAGLKGERMPSPLE